MKKWQIAGLVIAVVLIAGIVIAEQMTFSTYYPAPYGRYREFSTTGLTTLATDEFGTELENARVGIGTTNPEAKLDIRGNTSNTTYLRLGKYSGSPSAFEDWVGLDFWHVNQVSPTPQLTGNPAARISTYLQDTDNRYGLQFWTRDNAGSFTEKVRIQSNGNVGIGTVSPETKATGSGYLDAKDVWLRDANDGDGGWASEGGGGFGDWVDVTAAAESGNVQGPVASDGFIVASKTQNGYIEAFTSDSSSNPTLRIKTDGGGWGFSGPITMPVKKGEYWKISSNRSFQDKVWWIPLGN